MMWGGGQNFEKENFLRWNFSSILMKISWCLFFGQVPVASNTRFSYICTDQINHTITKIATHEYGYGRFIKTLNIYNFQNYDLLQNKSYICMARHCLYFKKIEQENCKKAFNFNCYIILWHWLDGYSKETLQLFRKKYKL